MARTKTTDFNVNEATVAKLQSAMAAGKVTSAQLTRIYLDRIRKYSDASNKSGLKLNLVRETDPDALKNAEAMDRERKTRGPRGPLHGIPCLLYTSPSPRD